VLPLFNDSLPIAALFAVLHPAIYRAFSLPVGLSLASVVARVDSSTSPMTNMQRRTQTSTALNVLRREIITVFCHRVSRNHEDDQWSPRPTHRDPFFRDFVPAPKLNAPWLLEECKSYQTGNHALLPALLVWG
jgi:hypothetical protein